jgi:hypothetical protein
MSTEARPTEGAPTPRPRRVATPLRAHAVLAAHADLANHRETFPAADADQGDLAMLLLVLVDLQHAALELARDQAGVVTKQLVGLGTEVKALTRRAGRAEALLQELVKQAKAANTTASEQADLLDELVETVAGRREEAEGEPAAEGVEPEEEGEGEEGDEEGLRALLRGGGEDEEDDFEVELDEGEEDGEPEEETEDGETDHGEGEGHEVVVPDGILTPPTAARGPRPDFDHPRAA